MAFLGCCDLSTVLLGFAGICLFIYLYGKSRNRAFKDTGIPGPEPDIFIGNLRLLAKLGFNSPDSKLRKQYGDVIGTYIGATPLITVFDLDILKEVFVKNFQNFSDRWLIDLNPYPVGLGLFFEKGAEWQRLRNILSPTFTAGKLRLMTDHINTSSETLTDKLMKAAEKKEIVDVKECFGGFTMDVIASTAFGIQVDSQTDSNNPFVAHARKLFQSDFFGQPLVMLATIFPSISPLLRKFGVYVFPIDGVNFFVRIVHQMIEERKQLPIHEQKKNRDFLQLLMNAEDNTDNKDGTDTTRMTKDEIFAQAFLFFAAGYETTATTLQFLSYALATNPEAQHKLIDEIGTVIGEDEPNYDNIQNLKYLDNVIQETLRLYPPVPAVTRNTLETVKMKGYTFPKGSAVVISMIQLHRDPNLYTDPNKFNPDRWEGKEKSNISWLPFGFGPRLCIGMRLAQVELKIALIHILRRVKFARLPDTPDVLEFKQSGLLSPTVPIKLKIEAL